MQNDKHFAPEPPPYGFSSAPPAPPAQQYAPPGYVEATYAPPAFAQADYVQPGYVQPGYVQPSYAPPTYAPPTQNFTPLPAQPVPVEERPVGCITRAHRNQPQMNALSAATLIFITGGMSIAWSVGFRSMRYNRFGVSTNVAISWFIGATIGAVISSLLPKVIPKKATTLVTALLVLVSGIVLSSTEVDFAAITASHYLNGIANGLLFAPTLTLASEVSVSYMRGKLCASTDLLSFNLGIFLQVVICSATNGSNPELIRGVLTAVFGFIGGWFAALLIIESPVHLLIYRNEQQAVDALRRLQRPFLVTTNTQAQLSEHKLYISDNEALSIEQSCAQALPTFIKIGLLRVLNALSISTFMHYVLWYINSPDFWAVNSYPEWVPVVFASCRLLGNFFSSSLMDLLGRKKLTLIGLIASAGVAFGLAARLPGYPSFEGLNVLMCVFQFFVGLAFSGCSAYLGEAFPRRVKQYFISFIFMAEMITFIIVASCTPTYDFFYVIGGLSVFVFIVSIWWLPETKHLTLREAQVRFSKGCC